MLGLLSCLGMLVGHNVRLAAAVGIGVICIMRVASVTHQGDARVRKAGRTRRGSWNQAGAPAGFETGLPNSPASGTRKTGSRTEKIATRKAVWLLLLVLAPMVAESVSNTRGTGREGEQQVMGPLGLNQLRLRERVACGCEFECECSRLGGCTACKHVACDYRLHDYTVLVCSIGSSSSTVVGCSIVSSSSIGRGLCSYSVRCGTFSCSRRCTRM